MPAHPPRPSPPLHPAARGVVLGLLLDARASYREARRRPGYRAELVAEGDAYRALARAIRAGAAHARDRYGWPYLITTPVQGLTTTLEA